MHKKTRKFINSINYFRGITIFIIVMGHMYGVSGFNVEANPLNKIFANIVTGGTSLFVFISGFMFHYVFYKKFNYKIFLKKKFENVVLPYLIMTTPIIFLRIFLDNKHIEMGVNKGEAIFWMYIRGMGMSSYWYIPFAVLLFIASPIYLKFIKLENKKQIIIMISMGILSGFIHRNNMNPLHSLVYFSPVYMLGIWYSINYNAINKRLKGKEIELTIGVLFFTYYQTFIDLHMGTYSKPFFEYRGIDMAFYQKIFLIFLFMTFFYRFEEKELKLYRLMAKYSFAIFFVHGYFSYFGYKIKDMYGLDGEYGILMLLFITTVVCLLSIGVAVIIKKFFGKNSRKIIGA